MMNNQDNEAMVHEWVHYDINFGTGEILSEGRELTDEEAVSAVETLQKLIRRIGAVSTRVDELQSVNPQDSVRDIERGALETYCVAIDSFSKTIRSITEGYRTLDERDKIERTIRKIVLRTANYGYRAGREDERVQIEKQGESDD